MPADENAAAPPATFAELGLAPPLLTAIGEVGYEAPTPIQAATIPALLAGRDVLGQAQTGTGKTAAFGLPLLQRVELGRRAVQALVLTPTRELAIQVAEALHAYGRHLPGLTVLPVYGGQPIEPQQRKLLRGVQVVVGTPGRVMDHLRRGALQLDAVRTVVLDEADEMLRMGFLEDVEWILSHAPGAAAGRQTALFSATMPAEIRSVTRRHLADPVVVEVERRALAVPTIEQRFLVVAAGPQKLEALTRLLETEPTDAVLVFTRTKLAAADLAERLAGRGYDADAIHGDMTQPLRERVLERLRNGSLDIVVATDVAARGLDVERIRHVVNYDIPSDVEAYVHRIGRTGRAGRAGIAVLFVTPRERRLLHEIERFTGQRIAPMRMPTPADVATRRKDLFKETLRKVVAEQELDLYLALVEEMVEEGIDLAELAAAAAWLAGRERPLHVALEPEAPRQRAAESADGRVRLSLDAGRRDGVRPADIVGALANEAGVPGPEIGAIDIHDRFTLVDVPARHAERAIERMAAATLRGRAVTIRPAAEGELALPRARPARPAHGAGPKRAARLGAGRRPGPPTTRKPAKPRRFP